MKKILSIVVLVSIISAIILTACTPETETTATQTTQLTGTTEGTETTMENEFFAVYKGKDEAVDFAGAPKAYIDIYPWGTAYTPVAYAQIIFREDDGFHVRMFCEEENPRAIYTKFDDPVYLDSCLEFFCDFLPEKNTGHYINTEMNANGAFLTYWAAGLGNYTMIADLSDHISTVSAFKEDNGWGVNLFIPLEMLSDIYDYDGWGEGSVIKGNFYKCGSDCEIPHYGVWSNIDLPAPNFHSPQFFGEIVIKKAK